MTKERYVGFGERLGAVPALTLPLHEVHDGFRRALWNRFGPLFVGKGRETAVVFSHSFWLRMARDKRWDMEEHRGSTSDSCTRALKEWLVGEYKESAWHEVYEFLESFPRWADFNEKQTGQWEEHVNHFLFQERSPYRFVSHKLSPIVDEQERESVELASTATGKYQAAAEHLGKAATAFSARPAPDYENACKEAASAVETALNIANGKQLDVGDAVKTFAKTYSVHPALMESANKLFGYASDRDGVRHGKNPASAASLPPVDFDEAKLVIVAASTWVNFIAAKAP